MLDRIVDALTDPTRRDRVMAACLTLYALLWTLYGVIAKSTQDIHFDMGEAVIWSREAVWGTPKHPPLSGWVAALWFAGFPRQDWAFYLLGMTLAATALWAAWKIFQRWLPADKAAVGVAMLTFVPFYNFHALKFNANSVLIPLWALVTWAFLRSFQTRSVGWAIFAGVAAAAAMLGKYWSAVLLLAIGVAAVAHPARRGYFRSVAPWLTIAAGAAVLVPHVDWLADHNFSPVTYAVQTHRVDLSQALRTGASYIGGAVAYLAAPIAITLFVARCRPAVLRDIVAPRDDDRRMAVVIFALPVVLPVVAALVARSEVSSIWSIAGATLLPVVLLSSPRLELSPLHTRRIVAASLAVPLIALLVAPVIALQIQERGPPNNAAYYKLLAKEVERLWGNVSPVPLRVIGGTNDLVNGASFYMNDAPATLDVAQPAVTPWVDDARIARQGVAWVCRSDDRFCADAVASRTKDKPGSTPHEVALTPRAFGRSGETRRFTIVIALPTPSP